MAFQSVPNTFEVDVNWTVNAQNCQNTFYIEVAPVDYGQDRCDQIASVVATWAAAEFLDCFGSSVTITSVTCRGLANIVDVTSESTDDLPVVGTYTTSAPLPNNNAYVVKRLSGLTGRSARGRIYLPLSVGMLSTDENFVSSGFNTAVQTALLALESAVNAESLGTQVIVSRYSGGAKRVAGVTFPLIGWGNTDLRVDSRRDRLP